MENYSRPTLEILRTDLDSYMRQGILGMSSSVANESDTKKRLSGEADEVEYATNNGNEISYGNIW